jgi:hypothetical protein
VRAGNARQDVIYNKEEETNRVKLWYWTKIKIEKKGNGLKLK